MSRRTNADRQTYVRPLRPPSPAVAEILAAMKAATERRKLAESTAQQSDNAAGVETATDSKGQ